MTPHRVKSVRARISWLCLCAGAFLAACETRNQDPGSVLKASFTFSPAVAVRGEPVTFTDTSAGAPTSWEWDFGDGATAALQNPNHTYAALGAYVVRLTVRAGASADTASRTVQVVAEPTGYYVAAGDPAASDANPGTEALPWKTIAKANQTLAAGETVILKAGTYAGPIAPRNSGTASGRITYRAYGSDVVTVANGASGIVLDGKSYITVQGIGFYNLDGFLVLVNGAGHNIIAYCRFDQGRNVDWSGSRIYRNSSYNWVHHCRFSKYGSYGSDDVGSLLDIGTEETATDTTGYNLIEDNVMFHGGHHVLGVFGSYNVIRNNYFHNEPWLIGTASSDRGAVLYGNRNVYFAGFAATSGRNLFEGNQVAYSSDPPDNVGSTGMLLVTGYNILRFNRFYHNDRAGLTMALTSSYVADIVSNRVYHNTFFHNGINTQEPNDVMNCAIGLAIAGGSHVIRDNAFKNNVFYRHRAAFGVDGARLADQVLAGNWDGDTQGNPQFVNASEVLGDPMEASLPDLHLLSASPCRDAGMALTTITSGSGTGTTFTVADAGYFMDGWGIAGVEGDEIQIVGTAEKARITKIDYGTRTITVATALTWTQSQGLALIHSGPAPDPGAHEIGP